MRSLTAAFGTERGDEAAVGAGALDRALACARELLADEPLEPVPGCPELVAHQARDVFALWERWEARSGARREPPFWARVWPAAVLAARTLLDDPALVAGRSVVDLGCGSGLAAIAASRAGAARVVANDVDPVALVATELNARANGAALSLLEADLTRSAARFGAGDVLVVGDLFYEASSSRRLLAYLHEAHGRGAHVLIADGGRPFLPSGLRVVAEDVLPVDVELEGVRERRVRLYRL